MKQHIVGEGITCEERIRKQRRAVVTLGRGHANGKEIRTGFSFTVKAADFWISKYILHIYLFVRYPYFLYIA
jgi:hypothetical protein